jgi:hypothetical protein
MIKINKEFVMTALLPAQQSLLGALNFHADCQLGGALGKVHRFGHEWIETREQFVRSGSEGAIGLVHSVATTVFHTLWSLTAGKLFSAKEPRELAVQSWKNLGKNLIVIFKSVIGIVSPSVAGWTNRHFFSLSSKQEQVQVKEQEFNDQPSDEFVSEYKS